MSEWSDPSATLPAFGVTTIFLVILIVVWHLIAISICISLVANDVEYSFKCLSATCMSFLVEFLLFAHFLIVLFGFFYYWGFCFVYIYLLSLRNSKSMSRGGAEREGERIPSRGFKLRNCGIMTWTEIKSWILNWLRHPGALLFEFWQLLIYFRCLVLLDIWSIHFLGRS